MELSLLAGFSICQFVVPDMERIRPTWDELFHLFSLRLLNRIMKLVVSPVTSNFTLHNHLTSIFYFLCNISQNLSVVLASCNTFLFAYYAMAHSLLSKGLLL